MPDACAGIGYIFIVIQVNFFLLESSDESFSIPVLPRPALSGLRKSQHHAAWELRDKHLKDIAPLDRCDESLARFGRMPVPTVSRLESGSNVDWVSTLGRFA